MSATTMAQGTRWPDKRARPGPVCDVCCIRPATLFCRNDAAFLCDACNARVHLSNPFAACHDLVSISDKSQLGTGVVKVDPSPTDATQQSSLLSGAELSHSSSTSDHALLRGTAGEALFDPIADSSLLELFSVGNFDTGLDDFQQGELDHDWIEAFEKESSQPTMTSLPAPASEPAGQGSHSARPGTEPLGESFTSQPGAFQLQTWNCDYDPTAQNPLPTNRSPSTFAPSVLQFLMTPFCPPAGTRSHLMPQCLQLQHTQHDSMDRKARVARYREKRKHRTFENKIRYASRKLYAESRPRIKGRFARPDELEAYLKEKEEAETQEKRKWTNMDNKLKHDK